MPKTFTDHTRHALNGPTMGTRWSALFHLEPTSDPENVRRQMQAVVAEIDRQMSLWKPESDINRLNASRPDEWVHLPAHLMKVLEAGVLVGHASGGAFDIGMGDAVAAWGFGIGDANEAAIRKARSKIRRPAHDVLELDMAELKARKHDILQFDLNGIAKGYGVDCLADVAVSNGIDAGLFSIDGELRALGCQPDKRGWGIAVELPDTEKRAAHSIIEVSDAAVATSGNYRHWIDLAGRRLSHTINPSTGMPCAHAPASATVVAENCMNADAWATAMMVLGKEHGLALATRYDLSVLFLERGGFASGECGIFA